MKTRLAQARNKTIDNSVKAKLTISRLGDSTHGRTRQMKESTNKELNTYQKTQLRLPNQLGT